MHTTQYYNKKICFNEENVRNICIRIYLKCRFLEDNMLGNTEQDRY